jgi:hypothetical protein
LRAPVLPGQLAPFDRKAPESLSNRRENTRFMQRIGIKPQAAIMPLPSDSS